jgi:hypothetical protein
MALPRPEIEKSGLDRVLHGDRASCPPKTLLYPHFSASHRYCRIHSFVTSVVRGRWTPPFKRIELRG